MTKSKSHLFPAWLSFILNNPIRRRFHAPNRVLNVLNVRDTDVVIDFGCGPGFYAIPFARVAARVVAIDVQPEMLQKTMDYAERSQVKVECLESDGRSIPLPDNIADLIFLSGVFHELNDKPTIFKELTRRGLISIGLPILKVSEVVRQLENIELKVLDKIDIENDTIIIATRSH